MIATCTELSVYRQGLSNLARLSGFEFTEAGRAATAQRVNDARASGVPESLIITAIFVPQNAWEEAAANLIDVVVPQELIRIQGAFQFGGVCASGPSNASSGIAIPDNGLLAFRVPPRPPLPTVMELRGLASAGTTSVAAPPVAVSEAQGGTVSGTVASTAESLGQTTRPVTEAIPGLLGGEAAEGSAQDQGIFTQMPIEEPIANAATVGAGVAAGSAALGVRLSSSVMIGLSILAVLAVVFLSRKKG